MAAPAAWTTTTGDHDNWDATYTWTFPTGGAADYTVQVYIPQSPYAAGGVTAYAVYGAQAQGQQDSIAKFTIGQRGHPGHPGPWATAGPFHTPGTVLQVNLANRSARGTRYAVTASAVRATCH